MPKWASRQEAEGNDYRPLSALAVPNDVSCLVVVIGKQAWLSSTRLGRRRAVEVECGGWADDGFVGRRPRVDCRWLWSAQGPERQPMHRAGPQWLRPGGWGQYMRPRHMPLAGRSPSPGNSIPPYAIKKCLQHKRRRGMMRYVRLTTVLPMKSMNVHISQGIVTALPNRK